MDSLAPLVTMSDMVNCELRVAVASCELDLLCEVRVASYELNKSCELETQNASCLFSFEEMPV